MPEFHVQFGAPVKASPEAVYAIFADYWVAHPAVLPRPPFTALDVIEGGQGAGTVIGDRRGRTVGARRGRGREYPRPADLPK